MEKKTSMPQEFYQITVKGHLNPNWADWFDGLTITPLPNGTTAISGPVVDQAALHGVLRKVRDLGVPLLSVTRVRPDQADAKARQRLSLRQAAEKGDMPLIQF
jgi:hypothetical protein